MYTVYLIPNNKIYIYIAIFLMQNSRNGFVAGSGAFEPLNLQYQAWLMVHGICIFIRIYTLPYSTCIISYDFIGSAGIFFANIEKNH